MNQVTPKPADTVGTISSGRTRFLAACGGRAVDRPPVWFMRQAGRALPEYRRLKESHTFVELVQTPALAAEVTMQPIWRFGFDAAILFSDIMVIPEALGQRYHFRETGGIGMDFRINSTADIDRLETGRVVERLQYVAAALKLVRAELGGRAALIGFSGSPWTLATFMLEGGSVPVYTRARALLAEDPGAFQRLLEKLTAAVTVYLQMQIAAGVDALQLFDSHGGQLLPAEFQAGSGRWMQAVLAGLAPEADRPAPPVIVFSPGTHGNWEDLAGLGAAVLGVDAGVPLPEIRRRLPPGLGVQGNLDPALLLGEPEPAAAQTRRLLAGMGGQPGHIFNLGHGVPPGARLETIAAVLEAVKSFQPAQP